MSLIFSLLNDCYFYSLPILSGTIVKINFRNKLIVKKLIDLISGLCKTFGKVFTEKMVGNHNLIFYLNLLHKL